MKYMLHPQSTEISNERMNITGIPNVLTKFSLSFHCPTVHSLISMKLTFAIKSDCFISHCTSLDSYCEDLFDASKFNYVHSSLYDFPTTAMKL